HAAADERRLRLDRRPQPPLDHEVPGRLDVAGAVAELGNGYRAAQRAVEAIAVVVVSDGELAAEWSGHQVEVRLGGRHGGPGAVTEVTRGTVRIEVAAPTEEEWRILVVLAAPVDVQIGVCLGADLSLRLLHDGVVLHPP